MDFSNREKVSATLSFIKPEFSSNYFVLKRSRSYEKYDNISECIIKSAVSDRPEAVEWLKNLTELERWKLIQTRRTLNVKDPSNPLTDDELLAIFTYTAYTPMKFYNIFTSQLSTGDAGPWNCYLDYLFSAFSKIKGTEEMQKSLYRGISAPEYNLELWDQKLHVGGIISTDAFTSTSIEQKVPAQYTKDHVIVNIRNASQYPKFVTNYAHLDSEDEFLYPPGCRFRIIKAPYYQDCHFVNESFECKDPEGDVPSENLERFRFLDLEDVTDELGYNPFEWYGISEEWKIALIVVSAVFVIGSLVIFVIVLIKRKHQNNWQSLSAPLNEQV